MSVQERLLLLFVRPERVEGGAGIGNTEDVWQAVDIRLPAPIRRVFYCRDQRRLHEGEGRTASAFARALEKEIEGDLDLGKQRIVLIAHSFGAFIAANLALNDVLRPMGMLLIDPAHPAQFQRLAREMPPSDWAVLEPVLANNSEKVDFFQSALALSAVQMLTWPTIILSYGRRISMPDSFLSPSGRAIHDAILDELQSDWLSKLANGRRIIARESGHFVQLSEPDLVCGQILGLLSGKL